MKKILYFFKIILHNHKYFKNIKKNTNKLILVEYNRLSSSIISYSYLSHILSKKLDAKICAYRQTAKKSIVKDLIWIILSKIKFFNTFQIYKSFGTQNFYLPNNFSLKNKYQTKIYKIIKDIKNKNDLLDLSIDNIYVGDLFYDSYLMDFHKETINLEDPIFQNYLKDVLKNFFFWKDFFKKNDVRAVVTSHSVYTLAIPLRIAISKNILAFQCSAEHLYSLSKKNLYAYKEFLNYKIFFRFIFSLQSITPVYE